MGRNKNKIKFPQGKGAGKIKTPDTTEVQFQEIEHPIFCLRDIHSKYGLSQCDKKHHSQFIQQLHRLSQLKWSEINVSGRHGMGYEKIQINSLNVPLHIDITDDVKFLLAFRYCGKSPFLGYRQNSLFRILFIDSKFSLYKH